MLELIFAGFVIATMAKIARHEGRPGGKWAGITTGLCFVSLAIPIPMVRMGIAFAAAFILMMVIEKEE